MHEQKIIDAFYRTVPLSGIYMLLNEPSIAWDDDSFDPRKGYVMACLSELAYLHLDTNEVPGNDRYKLFPGQAHELLYRLQVRFDVARVFGSISDLQIRIIETGFYVYAVVRSTHFAVVAVRGTVANRWRDWAMDFEALKNHARHGFYHRGFHDEAVAARPLIEAAVDGVRPLYFTGHSLGGAVASILSQLWADPGAMTPYVFASARFGTRAAASRQPRQAYVRPLDIVPHLPSRWMGFSDEGASIHPVPSGADPGSGMACLSHVILRRDFSPHAIEGYRSLIGDGVGQAFPERAYVDALRTALR